MSLLALLCFYALASAYWFRLSINGSLISIRSIFQRRQFSTTEIQQIRWQALGGNIVIHALDRKTRLGVAAMSREDRLEIIRFLPLAVPSEKQEGWPVYCHRVAIRWRDRKKYVPARPAESSDGAGFITRRRYDWIAATLIPSLLAVAIFAWWQFANARLFALLPIVITWHVLLRQSVPPLGQQVAPDNIVSSRTIYLLPGWIGVAIASLIAWSLLAPSRETGYILFFSCLAGSAVPIIALLRDMSAMEKARKQADAFAAPSAVAQWERGESEGA